MYISAKRLLEEFEACEEGILVFTEVYPDGLDPAAWTREEQLRVLQHTELRKYLGWAWRNNVVPQWSMAKANLNGTNLSWADLPWTDLCRANLTGADLTGAVLYGANLTGANLTRAKLIGVDLYQANLYGADLTGADLTGANLRGAIWDEREPPAGWRVNKEGRLEKQ